MHWVVLQTKNNNENKASVNLINQGYEVFFPKVKKNKLSYNKINSVFRPLFPGYIFVHLAAEQCYTKINNTFGVKKILKFGEKICFLPKEIFLKIKMRCDNNDICEVNTFKKGDRVNLISRKFNFEGIFDEKIDENRSFIFLEIMQRKIKTSVLNSSLEKF